MARLLPFQGLSAEAIVGIILLCLFPQIATWLPVALMGKAI